MTTIASGKTACPCTDVSGVLASLGQRSCQTLFGNTGVMLSAEGACVDHSYGSGCGRHDLLSDPRCDSTVSGESAIPDWCERSWCYVDAAACSRSPTDRAYRSAYFPREMGIDLFYSYTTCNSTAEGWEDYHERQKADNTLRGQLIMGAIPEYMPPMIFKQDSSGESLSLEGEEYYDNSVPYDGSIIAYVDEIMKLSNNSFTTTYTYVTDGGRSAHDSKYTAAVQDIHDGLADMGVGPFWITSERLKMTSFTIPLAMDRFLLAIPKRGSNSLSSQTQKVLAPFSMEVWALVIILITFTALVSVWFSGKRYTQTKRPGRLRKRYYVRHAADEFLQKGIFFCSAGVEQDENASLPQKLLMFGFGFFILILVSAYVANLAAFLTRPDDQIRTMQQVVQHRVKVCAHPVMKDDLQRAWPDVDFVFPQNVSTDLSTAVFRDFQAEKCKVMALGEFDITHNFRLSKQFCELDVVFTKSLVLENPIAFPIRPELAPGFSYWAIEGMKNQGITMKSVEEKYYAINKIEPICDMNPVDNLEAGEMEQIKPENLMFPVLFFLGFAVLAISLQFYHQWGIRRARKSGTMERTALGRASALVLRSTRFIVNQLDRSDKSDRDEQAFDTNDSFTPEEYSSDDQFVLRSTRFMVNQLDRSDKSNREEQAIDTNDSFTPEECSSDDQFHDNQPEQSVRKRVRFGDDIISAVSAEDQYEDSPHELESSERVPSGSDAMSSVVSANEIHSTCGDSTTSQLQLAAQEFLDRVSEINRRNHEKR